MGKYFHIESVDNERLLVIILSCEMTSVYWNELLSTIRDRHFNNQTVYFDFLYRNGYENRFFTANIDANSNIKGRLRRCDAFDTFEAISHRFFSMHEDFLASSILSRQQIQQYLLEFR